MTNPNLSGHQFGLGEMERERLRATGRRMIPMRASELLPHADVYHDDSQQPKVDGLAARIGKQGYRGRNLRLDEHIHLVHQSDGISALANGNHRVHAMTQIGYDKPVPVIVSDRRSPA